MTDEGSENLIAKIAGFLNAIGIETVSSELREPTFLPGIYIDGGRLMFDRRKLIYPGDLLHEAGHLAVLPADVRKTIRGEVKTPNLDIDALESYAVAWSYAAVMHLGIDPRVVFHEGGYRQCSARLILTYSLGVYPGANGLERAGMTATGERAEALGVAPYPQMLKWLCD